MKLSNLQIGTRLYLGFGTIILLTIVALSLVYSNFSKLGQANGLNIHTYQVMEANSAMLSSLVNIETGQRGFSLTGKDTSLEPLNSGKNDYKKYFDITKSLTSDNAKQQERLQKLDNMKQKWISDAVEPALTLRRNIEAGKEKIEAAVELERSAKGKTLMDGMRVLLAEIDQEERRLLEIRAKDAQALETETSNEVIVGGLLVAVLGIALALWLTRNITVPILLAVGLAKSVAKGDLTMKVSSDATDESGQLINALKEMSESLVRIVSEVRIGTDQISSASSQIASGNLDLSARTEQQAGSLEETASSMEELTSTVKQNADNAGQANQLALSASEVAQQGGVVVAGVVSTMGAINESAKKIVDIISVIDGIAFQTNILALNAAVEAARAGEQGRGFAVVATEVRNLAQRSAAAAKEIKALIGDSVEKVESGRKQVDQAGSTMENIVASVKRVTDIIAEIAQASAEQRNGIENVNSAIVQMDNTTQQNAALVEEAAAAASSMQDQAAKLSGLVAVFTLDASQTQKLQHDVGPTTRAIKPKIAASKPKKNATLLAAKSSPQSEGSRSARTKPVASTDDWDEF